MKKNLCIAILTVLSLSLIGCSEDLDYKKACEAKDFAKAYEIVDKLKIISNDAEANYQGGATFGESLSEKRSKWNQAKNKAEEAEKYVVLQEAMYVLESQGQNGLMRILGITKEHEDCAGWLYNELLDISSKMGDTELYEKIQQLGSSGYGY